jgi:Tfp pilus assembly PilM family ATPase
MDRPQLVNRLRGVLERQGFSGNDVVLAASSGQLLMEILDLPPRSSGAPIAELARAELARATRVQSDLVEMDFWDLPGGASRAGASTQVMAVGIAHSEANPLIDDFENCGMNVVALDLQGCALARALAKSQANAALPNAESQVTGILDIGWTRATLVLVSAGVVVYQRHIGDSAFQQFCERLSSAAGVDIGHVESALRSIGEGQAIDESGLEADLRSGVTAYIESIAEELFTAIGYSEQTQGAAFGTLWLTGGGAALPDLAPFLERRLERKVMLAQLGGFFPCTEELSPKRNNTLLMGALGLALHDGEVS